VYLGLDKTYYGKSYDYYNNIIIPHIIIYMDIENK